jgi:hypothetical protein
LLIHKLSVDEAARAIQRGMRPPSTVVKRAKKSKKAPFYGKAKAKRTVAPSRKVGRSAARQIQPNYWVRVKKELHILICTNDRKYESLRRQLGKESRVTQAAMVTGIGATIGASIGMSGTVIGPFVTLGLIALLRVGKNAWCAGRIE